MMTSLYPPLLGSVFWDRYGPGKRDGKWKTRTEKDVYTVVHHNPENPIAIIETSMGTTRAEIFLDVMPITASNFIDLANKRFYDGLHIHSVTPNYIVQVRVQRRDEERCPIENRHACGREHSGREREHSGRERGGWVRIEKASREAFRESPREDVCAPHVCPACACVCARHSVLCLV